MAKYKRIPIKAARDIANEFEKDQVIIVAWDGKHGREHVTTYGRTRLMCSQAADGGNLVKKALGWPDSLCGSQPARVTQLEKRVAELQAEVEQWKKRAAQHGCNVEEGDHECG